MHKCVFTEGQTFWYRLWCTGGIDPDDPYNPKDNPDHGIMVFFRDYWGAFLNYTPVKIVVLAVFIAYLGVSCYGITKTQEGLERRKLTRYDSYAATFFDMEDQFFRDYPYRIQVRILYFKHSLKFSEFSLLIKHFLKFYSTETIFSNFLPFD